MSGLGVKVAGGAAWMLGFRFLQRFIGLLSTVILARLLIPEDFGIVAMAMTVYALVEMLGEFGFDIALIQKQQADRRHYDTAWTFNVIYRSLGALALAAASPFIAAAFDEPRLEAVMYVIALVAFVQGLENIGIVAFRKELRFNLEFNFRIAKKVIAFVVTVTLAFVFRNYWALVLGILTSHLASTVLSYLMHPYRPRPSFAATKELFNFSGWVFLNSLVRYAKRRGPDLLVGKLAGSAGLGVYKIAYELATLPTTELYAPIMRAVFPGFSKISHDTARLGNAYLATQAVVATVTLPAGIAIVVLAEPLVYLLLGTKWLATIPLIQIVGFYGVTQILHGNRFSLFMALGRPYWVAFMNLLQAAIILPLMAWSLLQGHGIEMAAWSLVIASLVTLPVGLLLVAWTIDLAPLRFLAIQLRPALATTVMAGVVWFTLEQLSGVDGLIDAALQLVIAAPIGCLVYLAVLLGLWRLAGCPTGAETRILEISGIDRLLRSGIHGMRRDDSGTP